MFHKLFIRRVRSSCKSFARSHFGGVDVVRDDDHRVAEAKDFVAPGAGGRAELGIEFAVEFCSASRFFNVRAS